VNAYEYRGVTYPVLDLFFVARCEETIETRTARGRRRDLLARSPASSPAQLAFPSLRAAVRQYLERVTPSRPERRSTALLQRRQFIPSDLR
jgi:hypothetical protein